MILKIEQLLSPEVPKDLGLDIAKRFLKSGAKVIIWDIDTKMIEKAQKDLDSSNLSSNIVPMAVGAATTAITFNVGRRLLRKPINNINRNLMKPLLGAGIRL